MNEEGVPIPIDQRPGFSSCLMRMTSNIHNDKMIIQWLIPRTDGRVAFPMEPHVSRLSLRKE